MSTKPSYLGLLNAIALVETRAHAYLTAWISVASDPDVCAVLSTVAAREGEHGMAFAKRINELGYQVLQRPDPTFDEKLSIASSDLPDRVKLEKLGLNRLDSGDRPDIFDHVFADHSIDIRTGELLGRYICEERDTARLLSGCYGQLCARDAMPSAPDLDGISAKLDALGRALDELRQIVCAQATAALAQ